VYGDGTSSGDSLTASRAIEAAPAESMLPRRLGVPGVLVGTLALYGSTWWLFLSIAAPMVLCYALLDSAANTVQSVAGEASLVSKAAWLAETVPTWVVTGIGEAALCYLAASLYLEDSTSLVTACRRVISRWRPLAGLSLLFSALGIPLLGLMMAAATLPGVCLVLLPLALVPTYWLVRWSLAAPAVVLEDQRTVRSALSRSSALLKGAWWSALAITVLPSLFTGYASSRVSQLNGWAGYAVVALAAPVVPIALALLYYDRRARLDGNSPAPGRTLRNRKPSPIRFWAAALGQRSAPVIEGLCRDPLSPHFSRIGLRPSEISRRGGGLGFRRGPGRRRAR
jgi:hypothetical protein